MENIAPYATLPLSLSHYIGANILEKPNSRLFPAPLEQKKPNFRLPSSTKISSKLDRMFWRMFEFGFNFDINQFELIGLSDHFEKIQEIKLLFIKSDK